MMAHHIKRTRTSFRAASSALTFALASCADLHTAPYVARHVPPDAVESVVESEWSSLSADVLVTREVVDANSRQIVATAPRYRYSVAEAKASLGYHAVITRLPFQTGDIPDELKRPPSGRNLSRVEF